MTELDKRALKNGFLYKVTDNQGILPDFYAKSLKNVFTYMSDWADTKFTIIRLTDEMEKT